MTLGLLLAIFIASRRKDYRDLAKMAFVPGLFNINEPVMFGLPIVLNPILVIPFILVPFVNSLIGYFFISMEFIPPIAYAVPWTTPRAAYRLLWHRRQLAGAVCRHSVPRGFNIDLLTVCDCR